MQHLLVIAYSAIMQCMKAKHRKTLEALFATPTRADITSSDIERLIVALGGEVRAGAGSRVVFELKGKRAMYTGHIRGERRRNIRSKRSASSWSCWRSRHEQHDGL